MTCVCVTTIKIKRGHGLEKEHGVGYGIDWRDERAQRIYFYLKIEQLERRYMV